MKNKSKIGNQMRTHRMSYNHGLKKKMEVIGHGGNTVGDRLIGDVYVDTDQSNVHFWNVIVENERDKLKK